MTEQNSLDKFRSKEVEERFQELISGVVNEEFENMDTAMGMSIMAKSGRPVTTAELNVSFIRPFLGESFLIDTEILYMGRNLIRTRSTAYDEESGKLLASATANFAYVG